MDYEKIGKVIYELRAERNLTQKQLAEELNISDKTVSKWERGAGCPDISLLRELAKFFCVDMEKVLGGSLAENDFVGGSVKKRPFPFAWKPLRMIRISRRGHGMLVWHDSKNNESCGKSCGFSRPGIHNTPNV